MTDRRRTRWPVVAAAGALYLAGVSVALATGVPSALSVTPVFFAAVAWALGPRAGVCALLGCQAVSFGVITTFPEGSGPPPVAVLATVLPVDLLIFGIAVALRRTEDRQRAAEAELRHKNAALEASLAEVKELRGLLPICAWCKCVRDVSGLWEQLEKYLARHSRATFTHGICPQCAARVAGETVDDGPPAAAPPTADRPPARPRT